MSSRPRGANYEEAGIPERLRRRRERTIRMLRSVADTADVIYQSYAGRDVKANAAGLTGGVLAVIGGTVTLATGGLAAPAVLTALSLTSGGSSIAGGLWSIKNGYDRGKELENLDQRIRNILLEDEREIRDMLEEIIHRRNVRDGSVLEPAQVAREVHAMAGGLDGFENSSSCMINEMISRIPSVSNIISHGGFPILSGMAVVYIRKSIPAIAKPIEKSVEKVVVKKGTGKVTGKVTKRFVEISIGSETTEEGLKVFSRQIVTKQVTKEATEEGAKTVSTQLAKNGAETGAKTAAKVAGAVTVAFGGITTVWEGYNMYQNYCAKQEKSKYGIELRSLARKLERSLQTGSIPF